MEVKVDASDVLERLKRVEKALGKEGLTQLGVSGKRLVDQSVQQAFSLKQDPVNGRAWAPRKDNRYKHPLLDKSGGLKRSLFAKYEYERKNMYISGGVRDSRSGNRSYHAIAGVHYFGRKDQRNKIIGRGNKLGRGGAMQARRFIGLSRTAQKQLAEQAQRLIRRTA